MEPIKVWRRDGFTLRLWDSGRRDWRGQTVISYQFKDRRRVIFEGSDFAGSPMHADDSIDTTMALLSFLSLRPGDTDAEYFAEYTPAQTDWMNSRAETLASIVAEFEYHQETRRARAR